jgi:hypothetical protein
VGELGMIIAQMGTDNTSTMVAVYGTPCAIPPCNSKSVGLLVMKVSSATKWAHVQENLLGLCRHAFDVSCADVGNIRHVLVGYKAFLPHSL